MGILRTAAHSKRALAIFRQSVSIANEYCGLLAMSLKGSLVLYGIFVDRPFGLRMLHRSTLQTPQVKTFR